MPIWPVHDLTVLKLVRKIFHICTDRSCLFPRGSIANSSGVGTAEVARDQWFSNLADPLIQDNKLLTQILMKMTKT